MHSVFGNTFAPRVGGAASGKLRMFAALLATSILLAPIAYWRYGLAGLGLLAVYGFVVAAPYWPASWIESRLDRSGRTVGGLLAATGIRMFVPLVAALLVVVMDGRLAPAESVLLLVPLYLSVLCLDTVGHVQHRSSDGPLSPLAGSPRREQG